MSKGRGQKSKVKARWDRRWRTHAPNDFYHQYFFAQVDSMDNIARIAEQLSLKRGDAILEIGCGRGVTLSLFSKLGIFVVGIDFSKMSISKSKENFRKYDVEKGFLVCADTSMLPFKKGVFDAVYSFGTFEHLPDPKKSLNEMKRASKGVIHINIPSKLSVMPVQVFLGSMITKTDREYIVWYTKQEVERLFLEVGLDDVDIWKSNVLPRYGALKYVPFPFLKPYMKILLLDLLESFLSKVHLDGFFGRNITAIAKKHDREHMKD